MLVQHRSSVEPTKPHKAELMFFLTRSSSSVYGAGPSAGLNFETWLLAANSSFLDGAIVSSSCCSAGNNIFYLCCCSALGHIWFQQPFIFSWFPPSAP